MGFNTVARVPDSVACPRNALIRPSGGIETSMLN